MNSCRFHLPSPRLALLGALFGAGVLFAVAAAEKPDPQVERGRYLAHGSALCIDCHSPRDEHGQFIPGRHLTGAVIGFTPVAPMPWAPAAPAIAGLKGFTREQAVHFLMTGERPGGSPPRPPMPAYRLDREDAEALVAYLKSLPPPR